MPAVYEKAKIIEWISFAMIRCGFASRLGSRLISVWKNSVPTPIRIKISAISNHKKSKLSISKSASTLRASVSMRASISVRFGSLSMIMPLNGASTILGKNAIIAAAESAQTGAFSSISKVKMPVCENHAPK